MTLVDRAIATYKALDQKDKALLWTLTTLMAVVLTGLLIRVDSFSLKNAIETLSALFTVIAIIVGGTWTYLLFIRTRQRFPRAALTHVITHWPIVNGKVLLRVVLNVSNEGEVLLALRSGFTRVRQMVPWPTDVIEAINEGNDPVKEGRTSIDWPRKQRRDMSFSLHEREIEPNEQDTFFFDFIIDATIKTVLIYSYVRNEEKPGREKEIGWSVTTVYDLQSSQQHTEGHSVTD